MAKSMNKQVGDISGSFRWAPFLALQKANSFLTMLLLLSKYRMKSVPVVDLGEAKIDNIITQSAVIRMLQECAGLHWFESWGSKRLFELGLPLMESSNIIKVYEDDTVLHAFKLMRQKGVGGLPVVGRGGSKVVGDITIRDIQFLLIAPEIYKEYRSKTGCHRIISNPDNQETLGLSLYNSMSLISAFYYRSITAGNFLTAVTSYLEEHQNELPMLNGMVMCQRDDALKQVIMKLDSVKIQRIYVVDDAGNLEGVITLRDIISRLVHEPRGYFGDFFDGVLPQPANSRV
ncbi:UNVERIFIED_CONTAM: SNF1-related protein kinase regulatory subunit gamma-1 [Sesamum radiatum]|uniref:SNF1-related protein kinase regulatory subunit gamma-1 n=1 Tax=Sesamum radiatum TaxID=300843 RepID=A0AAW2VLC2_SESRA